MYATGDLTEWEALTHPDCIYCHSVISNVEALRQVGQHRTGGAVTASDVSTLEIDPGRFFQTSFRLSVAPSQIFDSTDAVLGDSPASTGNVETALIWENGKWLVRAVTATQG